MLVGIIGDIHGNIDALEAMHEHLKGMGVERIVCTGDVVGYGGAPSECIDFMCDHSIPCVCGNHDCYTAHPELATDAIREEAMQALHWNRKVLSKGQLSWLSGLPMSLDYEIFSVCHSSCAPYPEWDYVISASHAAMHFLFQRRPLCFNGHSHVPVLAMHRVGTPVIFTRMRNMILPKGMHVMAGVGAVGQPRDGDSRAGGVVFDTDEASIKHIRVSYDIGAAQRRIFEAGLPESLAYRLAAGR